MCRNSFFIQLNDIVLTGTQIATENYVFFEVALTLFLLVYSVCSIYKIFLTVLYSSTLFRKSSLDNPVLSKAISNVNTSLISHYQFVIM